MKKSRMTFRDGEGREQATTCRRQAVKAERLAAQTKDPDMRISFLSVKELWLDIANEIDSRHADNASRSA